MCGTAFEFDLGEELLRSEFLFRDRFNFSEDLGRLVADDAGAMGGPLAPGGPFAVASRNNLKSVFKKGFMHTVSCSPSVFLYISENKTLAGREDRTWRGMRWVASWQ